jgi:hypothetical protein
VNDDGIAAAGPAHPVVIRTRHGSTRLSRTFDAVRRRRLGCRHHTRRGSSEVRRLHQDQFHCAGANLVKPLADLRSLCPRNRVPHDMREADASP